MFRTQNNVPKVYVEYSRDFQLFCRLLDLAVDSVKYDILHITDSLTPRFVNNRFLTLLAHRIGFFTNKHIDDNILRYIISTFAYSTRNKGNIIGIKSAIVSVLRAENNYTKPVVVINNDTHTIEIYTKDDIINKTALNEYLRYVVPTGYIINYATAVAISGIKTELGIVDNATIIKLSDYGTAKIRQSATEYETQGTVENEVIGAFDTIVVPIEEDTTIEQTTYKTQNT